MGVPDAKSAPFSVAVTVERFASVAVYTGVTGAPGSDPSSTPDIEREGGIVSLTTWTEIGFAGPEESSPSFPSTSVAEKVRRWGPSGDSGTRADHTPSNTVPATSASGTGAPSTFTRTADTPEKSSEALTERFAVPCTNMP